MKRFISFFEKKILIFCLAVKGSLLVRREEGLLFCLLLICVSTFFASFARAETDFSLPSAGVSEKRKELDDILAGRSEKRAAYRENLCRFVETDYLATELGKIKYNDLFHDMDDAVQQQDVQILSEKIKATKNCRERFQLWVEYDDKWYADKRAKGIAERRDKEEEIFSAVQDTGDDVWDGVIGGNVLAVPRKYIWLSSNRKDSAAISVNIQIPYETQGGKSIFISGVLHRSSVRTGVCYGYESKKCQLSGYQSLFRSYVNCNVKDQSGVPIYKALWQKKCILQSPESPHQKNVQPLFDEKVKMWRIGESGYYEGTPEFPSYYLICGRPDTAWREGWGKNPRCQSALQINDTLYIYYSFPQREGFWEHREIQELVKKTVTGFLVQ